MPSALSKFSYIASIALGLLGGAGADRDLPLVAAGAQLLRAQNDRDQKLAGAALYQFFELRLCDDSWHCQRLRFC